MITITGPDLNQAVHCEPILRSLPDWFGMEDAIRKYSLDIQSLPTLLAWQADQVVGFLSIKIHNSYSAEVFVTGVRPAFHHQGIGTQLIATAEDYLQCKGIEYLQVKTLGPSHADTFYACTRSFYEKVGFRPLEEFKQIWNEENPCLIMIKRV
jgi:ribosomal protein S18 acetylase RimI-like enzyme